MPAAASRAAVLARVRRLCLSFPEVNERASHGAPTFFVRDKKSFCSFVDNHHGDGRLAIWCCAPPDAQGMLVDSDPEVFFVPPYVGPSGWIGVRLDRGAPWGTIAGVLEQAYRMKAPKRPAAAAAAKKQPVSRAPRGTRASARTSRPRT
jgi:hypothetical protein